MIASTRLSPIIKQTLKKQCPLSTEKMMKIIEATKKLIAKKSKNSSSSDSAKRYFMTYSQQQIRSAISNCPEGYMQKSLEQRNPGPLSAGSTFHTPQTRQSLMSQEWVWYPDPDCKAPAISFRTRLGGKLGIASLNDLPSDMVVTLRPAHKGEIDIDDEESPYYGQKDTELVGNVSSFLTNIDYTTLLCGPSSNGQNLELWTFFPGPCAFSWPKIGFESLQARFSTEINTIKVTVAQAIELGFHNIKHSTEC